MFLNLSCVIAVRSGFYVCRCSVRGKKESFVRLSVRDTVLAPETLCPFVLILYLVIKG
jgi:hypothetical protein